jgi:3'-phosphoadenosine 5'-phosphosulfate sulfotransferase (PAPS reductase)/FAD synthetase
MKTPLKSIVTFSSGISSWAAGKRYAEIHGTDGMVLLFADTKIEDEDNYRFLGQAAANIGAPLVKITDGRDPWEVMNDEKIIGNSRIDPCSKILKRQLLDRWRNKHADPETTTIITGIAFDEVHRIENLRKIAPPWNYIAPLCDKPWMSKAETLDWAKREGIEPPRMYDMGFAHANCGGFCIKAGQKSFALLLEKFPERYAWHEEEEEKMRQKVGNHSILRCRKGGVSKPLTLREFRERIEKDQEDHDGDIGGCACALPL